MHWHYPTGQKLATIEGGENQINCIQYANDGKSFAVAGSDPKVLIYDAKTQKLKTGLDTG